MATITRENIGLLHEKLTVSLSTQDYQTDVDAGIKDYAKKYTLPGFRKGMVPKAVLVKKLGAKYFADILLKKANAELSNFLTKSETKFLYTPVSLYSIKDIEDIDITSSTDISFPYEVGLMPDVDVDLLNIPVTKFEVEITDEMVTKEITRLRNEYGVETEPDHVVNDSCMINASFVEVTETGEVVEGGVNQSIAVLVNHFTPAFSATLVGKKIDETVFVPMSTAFSDLDRKAILNRLMVDTNEESNLSKHFQMTILKVNYIESAPLDVAFFEKVYTDKSVNTEAELREKLKAEISQYYNQESNRQILDQVYHYLVDELNVDLPEHFLVKVFQYMLHDRKNSGLNEHDTFKTFLAQVKWNVIVTRLGDKEQIKVTQEDMLNAARAQVYQFLGNQVSMFPPETLDEYAIKMVQDKKFTSDAAHGVRVSKLLSTIASRLTPTKVEQISAEAFAKQLHHHHF